MSDSKDIVKSIVEESVRETEPTTWRTGSFYFSCKIKFKELFLINKNVFVMPISYYNVYLLNSNIEWKEKKNLLSTINARAASLRRFYDNLSFSQFFRFQFIFEFSLHMQCIRQICTVFFLWNLLWKIYGKFFFLHFKSKKLIVVLESLRLATVTRYFCYCLLIFFCLVSLTYVMMNFESAFTCINRMKKKENKIYLKVSIYEQSARRTFWFDHHLLL